MKRLLWATGIALSVLSACNYDEGQCWIDGEGAGSVGAGGGPIVPGAGGYGDAPPPEPQDAEPQDAEPQDAEPQDAEPQQGCKDNEWSDKPSCNRQFIEDRARCQKAKTKRCWASQMARLVYCERHDGKTGFPELDD